MGIFDFLRKKHNGNSGRNLSGALEKIETAVEVFEENPNEQWLQILGLLTAKLKDEALALDLFRFIPMAYCRMMLPQVNFPDHYAITENNGIQRELKLAENQLYVEVDRYVIRRFIGRVSQEDLMSVLNHSAEFSTINKALDSGSKLDDLVLGAPIFT